MAKILITDGGEDEKEFLHLLSLVNEAEKVNTTLVLLRNKEPYFSEEMFKQEYLLQEKPRPSKYDKIFGRRSDIPKVLNTRNSTSKRVFRPRKLR